MYRKLKTSFGFFIVFICNIFVTCQCMSIGHVWGNTDSLVEAFDRGFMLFLETIAVANYTHGFWDIFGLFETVVAEIDKRLLFLQVPQTSAVVL